MKGLCPITGRGRKVMPWVERRVLELLKRIERLVFENNKKLTADAKKRKELFFCIQPGDKRWFINHDRKVLEIRKKIDTELGFKAVVCPSCLKIENGFWASDPLCCLCGLRY